MTKRAKAGAEEGHQGRHLVGELTGSNPRITIAEGSPLGALFEDRATLSELVESILMLKGNPESEETWQRIVDGVGAFLADVGPRNALEAALAAQMYACHELAMLTARRARHSSYVDQVHQAVGQTVKLQRTFALQLEALAKLRGKKTHQEVTVRHVTGENVVPFPEGGGGGKEKTGTTP